LGGHFVQFGPKGYQLPDDVLAVCEKNCKESGGTIELSDNADEALKDADFVYTDVWYGLYNDERSKEDRMNIFYPKYQVTNELMRKAKPTAKFMHCLPATRGEEVHPEVIDGSQSVVFDEAENRLTAQRALLVTFMRDNKKVDPEAVIECRRAIEQRYGKVAE
jgi:putrescine carbamoyltransferase